jgi:hypothetical protein
MALWRIPSTDSVEKLGRWDTWATRPRGPRYLWLSLSDRNAPGSGQQALRAEVSLTHEAYRSRSYTAETISLGQVQDWSEFNSACQMLRLYGRGLRYRRPGAAVDAVLDTALWGLRYTMKTLLPTGRN